MINYVSSGDWASNMYALIGLVVASVVIGVGIWQFLFKDWSDSI